MLDEADKMLDLGLQEQLGRIRALLGSTGMTRKKAAAHGKGRVQVHHL